MHAIDHHNDSRGFSLIELVIAMTVTLVIMGAATTLIAGALRIRARENQKSDALADAQRAINIMSREIADAGFNINPGMGIVASESDQHRIRFRANLNRFDTSLSPTDPSRTSVFDPGEDVSYFINLADNTKYLARHDEFRTGPGDGDTVLANRLDSFNIHYFDQRVAYTAPPGETDIVTTATEVAPNLAKYIVIAVSVNLDQIGTEGSPGYQRAYTVLLCSDVALRNNNLSNY
jgi:prepilin-type N-terminal cleavage/methylation domain-containing protein